MNKIPCSIIQDLLPLYVDDACSEQSKGEIAEHLKSCQSCQASLAMMSEELLIVPLQETEQNHAEAAIVETLARAWNKSKLYAWMKGVAAASFVCALIIVSYMFLAHWKLVTVPAQSFSVVDVYQLSDGSISYRLKATDGYEVHSIKKTMDDEGNEYVTAYRPIIKKKANLDYGLHNYLHRIDFNDVRRIDINLPDLKGDDIATAIQFDLNEKNELFSSGTPLKAVYYGTSKDRILIWQQGMELPKASVELEQYWLKQK